MDYQNQSDVFFSKVLKNPKLELEWVDLLSQLEFVGCRKIMKAVGFDKMNLQSLKHFSEEATHTYLLRSAAEQSGLMPRSWSEGLFSNPGFEYFSQLDREVSRQQPDERSYPAVSWVVETRVLTLYPWYIEKTSFPKVKRVLTQILAQERMHSQFFGHVPFTDTEKGNMLRTEERLWQRFLENAHRVVESL